MRTPFEPVPNPSPASRRLTNPRPNPFTNAMPITSASLAEAAAADMASSPMHPSSLSSADASSSSRHHRHRPRPSRHAPPASASHLNPSTSPPSAPRTGNTSQFHPQFLPQPSSTRSRGGPPPTDTAHKNDQHSHRTPAAPIPVGLSPDRDDIHSQSFVPPHVLAAMARGPEPMARSYGKKRRPPPWI